MNWSASPIQSESFDKISKYFEHLQISSICFFEIFGISNMQLSNISLHKLNANGFVFRLLDCKASCIIKRKRNLFDKESQPGILFLIQVIFVLITL